MIKTTKSRGNLAARSFPRAPFKNSERRTCLRAAGLLALLTVTALPLAAADPDQLYRAGDYRAAQQLYGELDLKHPQKVRYRYNRGCAAYQAGDYAAAAAAFKSSLARATDDGLRYRCNFNLGNTAFKQADYAAAAGYYKQALRLRPGDNELKFNLELALRRLAEQPKPNKQSQQDQKQQQGQKQSSGQSSDKPQKQAGQQGQPQAQTGQRPQGAQGQNQTGRQPGQPQPQPGQTASQSQGQDQPQPGQARSAPDRKSELDRQRAAALIESVRENRPPRPGSGELPPSGKYW